MLFDLFMEHACVHVVVDALQIHDDDDDDDDKGKHKFKR